MARARLAAHAALMVCLLIATAGWLPPSPSLEVEPAAVVGWPPSSGLVVAEVVTGGVSASDELVELANLGTSPVDLAGLEVAYVTSSGATTTRKASWTTSVIVAPGRHVLLANALGVHASIADTTYSGGLAATGGAIVLRPVGGSPLDAVGWGDAGNAFVEGNAAPAPPAGQSIERVADTNENAADFVLNPAPVAQGLAWNPTPPPTPSPSAEPTVEPTPEPTADPTSTPATALPIADVRLLADGSRASVEGVVTVGIGAIDGSRGGFLQDESGGIGVYLDAVPPTPITAGTRIRAAGTIDSRYAQRVLRIALADVTVVGSDDLPPALTTVTGETGEPNEGLRLQVTGTVTEAPSAFADGLGLLVDDGTGPVRVIVGPEALAGQDPRTGALVTAIGPLGQRDSSGSGSSGYRQYSTLPGELVVAAAPTPTPTAAPTPTPTAAPTPSPSPTLGPTASPVPSPTPSPSLTAAPMSVAAVRLLDVGSTATVRGVVIAEAGRLGTPPLLAIADVTGGLPVKLADGMPAPSRGTLVEVRGTLADPYGQTELRLASDGLMVIGTSTPPAPLTISSGDPGEALEGRLATVRGTITTGVTRATSGDITFTIQGADGATLRIMADASAAIDVSVVQKGAVVSLTGIIGQRASRKDVLDGYRLWLRDRADLLVTAAPTPAVSSVPGASPSAGSAPMLSIAKARLRQGERVSIEGIITIDRDLLDASGRRTIAEDVTGAVELYLASADAAISAGVRVRVTGTMGTAWGAPRLRVDAIRVTGRGTITPLKPRGEPGASVEWRLVEVRGTLAEVHRSGDRWTADLVDGVRRIALTGLAGSGIPADRLVEGRIATVTGIVKRAYPTATDQRFSVVPRSSRDVVVVGAAGGSAASPGTGPSSGTPANPSPHGAGTSPSVVDIALSELAANVGRVVRVGGIVTGVELGVALGVVRLEDGTAAATIALEGAASDVASLVQPGDTLNATGTPDDRDEIVLVVSNPADVVLLAAPGGSGTDATGDRLDSAASPRWSHAELGVVAAADAATALTRGIAVRPPGTAMLAIATLLLSGLIAACMAAYRITRSRRATRARIQARLDAFGVPADPTT